MYYPDYANLKHEFSHYASETEDKAYTIEISTRRAVALADAALLYCRDGDCRYVPNGHFSDAEVELWSIMCRLYRAAKREDQG